MTRLLFTVFLAAAAGSARAQEQGGQTQPQPQWDYESINRNAEATRASGQSTGAGWGSTVGGIFGFGEAGASAGGVAGSLAGSMAAAMQNVSNPPEGFQHTPIGDILGQLDPGNPEHQTMISALQQLQEQGSLALVTREGSGEVMGGIGERGTPVEGEWAANLSDALSLFRQNQQNGTNTGAPNAFAAAGDAQANPNPTRGPNGDSCAICGNRTDPSQSMTEGEFVNAMQDMERNRSDAGAGGLLARSPGSFGRGLAGGFAQGSPGGTGGAGTDGAAAVPLDEDGLRRLYQQHAAGAFKYDPAREAEIAASGEGLRSVAQTAEDPGGAARRQAEGWRNQVQTAMQMAPPATDASSSQWDVFLAVTHVAPDNDTLRAPVTVGQGAGYLNGSAEIVPVRCARDGSAC